MAQKDISVTGGGSDTVYLRGHDQYDAVRIDFDSSNSDGTDVDVTVKTDRNNDLDDLAFGSMETTVLSSTANDVSTGDPSYGTTKLARSVAVEVDVQTGSTAEATVNLHNASDSAMNADAYLDY